MKSTGARRFHEKTGNAAVALAHFRRFHTLQREVQTEAARDKLRALQIQFELSAARREAEIERERQESLTHANAELDAPTSRSPKQTCKRRCCSTSSASNLRGRADGASPTAAASTGGLADIRARAAAITARFAVAMADLDHFKACERSLFAMR